MFLTIWYHINNVVNKNMLALSFLSPDVIRIKIFYTDNVRAIFDIDFSYTAYQHTNMIISMKLLIRVSCNT